MNQNTIAFLLNSLETTTAQTTQNNWPDLFSGFGQFFFRVLLFIGILFLAYYTTKKLNKAKMGSSGKNLCILESLSLGMNGSMQLVKVGERFVLIGVTKEKISFLTDVDANDVTIDKPRSVKAPFDKYFSSFFNKSDGKDNENEKS